MRPVCQSWRKKTPFRACTASTIGRQAATCASDQMPGVSAYPTAWGEMLVASLTISPAPARWL